MGTLRDRLSGLSFGSKRFAAVDFDGRQLRVVHAERVAGRTRILKLAAVATPEQFDQDNPKAFGEMLGRTLRDMGLGGVGVLMNVPRGQAVLKPVSLPPGTPQSELANMVQFQMEKELPFRTEEAVIDFTVETHYDVEASQGEAQSAGIDVLVGAVRLPVLDHYRQIAAAAGAKLLRVGLRPYANMRCVDACTRRGPQESVLVIHLGADETEIDVLVGSSLAFSRSANVKVPPSGASRQQVSDCAVAVVREVARSVQSFQAVERRAPIEAALVAGGTGIESRVAEELTNRLGIRAEPFNPAGALRLGDEADASGFISALGLAIGHHGAERLPFDFLNPKRPQVPRDVKKIALIAAAAVLVVGLAAGIAAAAVVLGNKQARIEKLREDRKAEMDNSKKLKRLRDRVVRIRQWHAEDRDWLTHWAYISALFPSCKDAYIASLKTGSDGSISFTVNARDSKIIGDLEKRLAEEGYKFKPGRIARTSDAFGYSYSEDVRVFVTGDMQVDLRSVRGIPRPKDDDSISRLMQLGTRTAARSVAPTGRPSPSPGPRPSGPPAGRRSVTPAPSPRSSARPGQPDPTALLRLRQELLAKFDSDRDGRLSRSRGESTRAFEYVRKEQWRIWDVNGNRELDRTERYAMYNWFRQFYDSRDSRDTRRRGGRPR